MITDSKVGAFGLTDEQANRRVQVWFEPGGDTPESCHMDSFIRDNVLPDHERAAILALDPGQHFHGGGGAFALFTVERVS